MDATKILIVEDESLVGLDIQNNLEDMGYRVTSIHAEAHTALAAIPTELPDLILMDIKLRGEMDGVDAAQTVSDRFGIPVLFLTAYADGEILERAREVGAFGYMIKPFTNRELRAMVEVALSKSRLDQKKRKLDDRIRLAQKNESIRIMAGGLAHRLNNSLQAVIGNLSLINPEILLEEPAANALLDAKDAANNAAELGRQLLACSGHGFFNAEAVDLNELIKQTMFPLEAVLPPTVHLKMELAENLQHIHADFDQVAQVLIALVTNSVEAMNSNQETITIKTMVKDCDRNYLKNIPRDEFLEAGQYVCFSVADTGCGMDEKVSRDMFDPFFSTKFTGRGLGLAAALGIVQTHKGTVEVVSGVGEGTSVMVLFPVGSKTSNDSVRTR